ncbi:MAG: hypothetical protein IPJ74_00605 [Saprospiraceae bacterium]|nr:hypothetical protein [Saprospiraceae bacterium]
MKNQELIDRIHEAVIENELAKALKELKKIAKETNHQNAIILLISQLKEAEREQMLDIEDERVISKKVNRIRLGILELLNELSAQETAGGGNQEEIEILEDLLEGLEINTQTFLAQTRLRKKLTTSLFERHPELNKQELVSMLSSSYDQMSKQEQRLHHAIRGYTKNVTRLYNEQALKILTAHPEIKDKVKRLKKLEQHLVIWKSKYESIFEQDDTVCLVYIGVEERVPFPKGIENDIREYLNSRKTAGA